MKKRRIIDNRKKQKFMMDDEFIDKMAKLCGWQGTIVYNSLCRHTNKNQECFPSIKLMAEQHNVSRPTIMKGIEALKKRNVIDVGRTRSKGGKWLNNIYILLDKSDWDYSQVNVDAITIEAIVPLDDKTKSTGDTLPSQCDLHSQVNNIDSKETHFKETHKKETHLLQNENVLPGNNLFGNDSKIILPIKKDKLVDIFKDGEVESTVGSKINQAIELFRLIVPGDFVGSRTAFKKKPTREAVEALIKRYTLDQIEELIWEYDNAKEDQYRPRVGTVYEFCTSKLAKIEAYVHINGCGLWPKNDKKYTGMTTELCNMSKLERDKFDKEVKESMENMESKPWNQSLVVKL